MKLQGLTGAARRVANELEADGRLIRVSTSGPFRLQQQRQMFEELAAHPAFSPGLPVLDKGVNFGVGRQFATLTDLAGGHGFRLFKDERLALCWLRGEPL